MTFSSDVSGMNLKANLASGSIIHHARLLLTSLYRGPFAIPATNYSIRPQHWERFLDALDDDAIISRKNDLHFPVGAKVTEFKCQKTYPLKNTLGPNQRSKH